MKHIEKLSYKYINTYGRLSQHRKSEESIIDKINEIIDILEKEGFCKIKDKNSSQLLEIVKLQQEIDRLNNIINELEKDINNQLTMTRKLDKYNEGFFNATLHFYNRLKALKEDNNNV